MSVTTNNHAQPTPVIAVTILDGGITVNGQAIPAEPDTDPHQTAIHTVARLVARPLGRPVRTVATDRDGRTELVVHPDGTASDITAIPQAPREPVLPAVVDIRDEQLDATHDLEDALEVTYLVDRSPDASSAVPLTPRPSPASTVRESPAPWGLTRRTVTEPTPATPRTSAHTQPAPRPEMAPTARPRRHADTRPPATSLEPAASTTLAAPAARPTLHDLLSRRPATPTGPATTGWRAAVRRVTGGLLKPRPSPQELARREAVDAVQRSLDGPKTVVVVNPKGGAHKTTATLLIAATFGGHRGGYTLAWDNNETRGTLGWRANPARHGNTAVTLLRDLDRFSDVRGRVGDLDNYVRSQGNAQFDVLASDEDAASAASIDADAFQQLHSTLARFYRIMVIDTGNNMRASNWQAAVEAADQLVIVSTVREDTAQSAAWLVDALRAGGQDHLVEQAVTVLSAPARTADPSLQARLHDHFRQLTRVVLDVPHDPALVPGGPIAYDALTPASRDAWLRVTAAVADGL